MRTRSRSTRVVWAVAGAVVLVVAAVLVFVSSSLDLPMASAEPTGAGAPSAAGASPSFPDVSATHPYYAAISGMASRQFIGGYTNGNFGPEDQVMRQQFAKMIVKTLGLAVAEEDFPNAAVPFVDLGDDNLADLYPHEFVAVCAVNGITRGVVAGYFDPWANITRAQVITMIVRAANNLTPGKLQAVPGGWAEGVLPAGDPDHGANIAKAEYNGLLAGIQGPGGALSGWDIFGNATRGEVAQILWNLFNAGAGGGAVKLPDAAMLVDTAAWGEVPVNQICVVLADAYDGEDAEALAEALGGSVVGRVEEVNIFQIETAGTSEADLASALAAARATAGVTLAAPNQPVAPAAEGEIWGVRLTSLDDPAYAGANGEGYNLIGVQSAWDYIRGSGLELGAVQVGVVDTGMYTGNGQFDGGANISYSDPKAQLSGPETIKYSDGSTGGDPAGGHGTSINTIIGADEDDGGPAGIASILGGKLSISNTNIFAAPYGYGVKQVAADPNDPSVVTWADGNSYSYSDLAAIMAQVNAGSKVINLSWGPDDYSKVDEATAAVYRDFFAKLHALKPGVVFVASAGNDGQTINGSTYYPAGFGIPNLITVGNTNNDGSMFTGPNGSNVANTKQGEEFEVTLSAPGEQAVRGYDPNSGQVTANYGGTSMAAPQVAAAAALLLSINPALEAGQIKDILRVTARQNAAGDPILALDEAVFETINLTREINGQPALTREEMRNQGVIDAVALPVKDAPNEYLVRGIVQSLSGAGVDVTITLNTGEILDGETPRHMSGPGEVGWLVRMDEDDSVITVYRQDNKAGSRISLEKININGSWAGTYTITAIDIDEEAQGDDEGCDLLMDALIGTPAPMTMEISVDDAGTGTATTFVDYESVLEDVNNPEPAVSPITYSGNVITFLGDAGGLTGGMTGTVIKQSGGFVIKGTASPIGEGYTMRAVYTVTKD